MSAAVLQIYFIVNDIRMLLPDDDVQGFMLHHHRLDIFSVPNTLQSCQYRRHLKGQSNMNPHVAAYQPHYPEFKSLATFLATTSAGKLCLEMTHNALVHVFLSVDFITRQQSAEKISVANVSGK